MKRFILVLGLLAGAIAAAGAQNLTAAYVEGTVSIETSGSWSDLHIGDVVSSGATIRLGSKSYAEISSVTRTVKLTAAGTYNLQDLFTDAQAVAKAGLGTLFAQRLAALSDANRISISSTIGGVRGSDASAPTTEQWAGQGGSPSMIQTGIAKLKAGDFTSALYSFTDAYDAANTAQAPEARFYMGYAAYRGGDVKDALDYLTTFAPNPAAAFYSDHVLTLAEIYVETFAYEDALHLLSGFLDGSATKGVDTQTGYLLQGIAYGGTKDKVKAAAALKAARDENPASQAGQAAATMLAGL